LTGDGPAVIRRPPDYGRVKLGICAVQRHPLIDETEMRGATRLCWLCSIFFFFAFLALFCGYYVLSSICAFVPFCGYSRFVLAALQVD
jgi:hypothetical protein